MLNVSVHLADVILTLAYLGPFDILFICTRSR